MDMPIMKKKRTVASQAAARGPLPELPEGLLDELVKGPMTPTEVQGLCQLVAAKPQKRQRCGSSKSVGRILGDAGEFAPSNESGSELFAIE